MRDHGASAVVPLNRCLMIGCILFSLLLLPWWITLAVVVLVAALWRFASDPYGGMQVSLLLLMGMFLGLSTIDVWTKSSSCDGVIASGLPIAAGAIIVELMIRRLDSSGVWMVAV